MKVFHIFNTCYFYNPYIIEESDHQSQEKAVKSIAGKRNFRISISCPADKLQHIREYCSAKSMKRGEQALVVRSVQGQIYEHLSLDWQDLLTSIEFDFYQANNHRFNEKQYYSHASAAMICMTWRGEAKPVYCSESLWGLTAQKLGFELLRVNTFQAIVFFENSKELKSKTTTIQGLNYDVISLFEVSSWHFREQYLVIYKL